MNHTKKEPNMVLELFQAFTLSFRLTIADPDEGYDRCNIHHGQRLRILCSDFTSCDQRAEDAGMVFYDTIYISFRVKSCQL